MTTAHTTALTAPAEPLASPAERADATEGPICASSHWFGGAARHEAGVDVEGAQTTLATLRSPIGHAVDPHNAKPTDRVNVNGMETTVANALRMGALTRNPSSGALQEGAVRERTPQSSTAASEPAHPALAVELNREASAIRENVFNNVPRTALTAAIRDAVGGGEVSPVTLNAIASSLEITPEEARAQLHVLGAAMGDQRSKALSKLGIDPTDQSEFGAWVERARPDALREAVAKHITKGDLSGYQGLASAYFENLDTIAPERILQAEFGSGITARMVGHRVILSVPGKGEMEYRSAVRMGLLRVR